MTTTIITAVLVAFMIGFFFGGLLAQIKVQPYRPALLNADADEIDMTTPDQLDTHSAFQHITIQPKTGWILYGDDQDLCLTVAEEMAKTVGRYQICDAQNAPYLPWLDDWPQEHTLIISNFNPTKINIIEAQKAADRRCRSLIFISSTAPKLDNSNLRTLAV